MPQVTDTPTMKEIIEMNAALYNAFDAMRIACEKNRISPDELLSYFKTVQEMRENNNKG